MVVAPVAWANLPQDPADERWLMGPTELATWELVNPQATTEPGALDASLAALSASGATPAEQGMLLFFRCRNAVRNDLPVEQAVLAGLEELGATAEPALQKCEQLRDLDAGRTNEAFGRSLGAYQSLGEETTALLTGWIAYDYAQDALDAGHLGDAMDAASASLAFARANGLRDWEAESLGVIAVLRGVAGRIDEALSDNEDALGLTSDPWIRGNLSLNRGYLLRLAGRDEQAREVYEQVAGGADVLHRHRLHALSHLGGLAIKTGQVGLARSYLAQLESLLAVQAEEALTPYPGFLRAYLLLDQGEVARAQETYDEALAWLEARNYHLEMVQQLEAWSGALEEYGHSSLALASLREATALRDRIREQERSNHAELVAAIVTGQKRRQDYLLLEQQNQLALAELERRRATQRALLVFSLTVLSLVLALVVVNRRLRATKRALAEKNAELDFESSHDPLTRVLNRRAFLKFLDEQLPQLPERRALVMLVDIDRFKAINDGLGHRAGDEVLRAISARLAGMLRASDRVARWGGEEFLVYMDAPRSEDQVVALVGRVLACIGVDPVEIEGVPLQVTASAGFALVHARNREEFEKTLDAIDGDLYGAKSNGRNQALGRLPQRGTTTVPGPIVVQPD